MVGDATAHHIFLLKFLRYPGHASTCLLAVSARGGCHIINLLMYNLFECVPLCFGVDSRQPVATCGPLRHLMSPTRRAPLSGVSCVDQNIVYSYKYFISLCGLYVLAHARGRRKRGRRKQGGSRPRDCPLTHGTAWALCRIDGEF